MVKVKTPKHGHPPIKMNKKAKVSELSELGDFFFKHSAKGPVLFVMLPYRNKSTGKLISSWTIDHKNLCNAQWSWDKNQDKPTLKPSLHAVGIWHGWVKSGYLVEA